MIDQFRAAHPDAARVLISDISLPKGGPFGKEYGGLGHVSHQIGLDVDIYYPRLDHVETAPLRYVISIMNSLRSSLIASLLPARSRSISVRTQGCTVQHRSPE